jgi:N-acetylglucosaminyldiphosphoundecaprenol N-acetyl-beta-D-mannosaminyltransferase
VKAAVENLSADLDTKKIRLLGTEIDALALDQLLFAIRDCIENDRLVVMSYVNIHTLNIAYETPWFKGFLNDSYLTFCDGVGVKLAARLTGQDLPQRFTPPDFMESICELASRHDWKVFFLGARSGVAQRAADKLTVRLPGLQIRTHHGYFDKAADSQENRQVVEQINQFQPHILVVGFGMPVQEKWILENIASLHTNMAFPAGAIFDYLSGEVWRGPRWLTDHGFEWLSRLVIEPRRLWKRYLIGNPLFVWRIFVHHVLGYPLPE